MKHNLKALAHKTQTLQLIHPEFGDLECSVELAAKTSTTFLQAYSRHYEAVTELVMNEERKMLAFYTACTIASCSDDFFESDVDDKTALTQELANPENLWLILDVNKELEDLGKFLPEASKNLENTSEEE
jgi:hypothetical protein